MCCICTLLKQASKEGRELIVSDSDNEKAIIQKRKFLGGVDDQSLKKSWFSSTSDVHTGSREGIPKNMTWGTESAWM